MSVNKNRIEKIFRNTGEAYVVSGSIGHLSLCTLRTCVQWVKSNPFWDSYIDNIKIIKWKKIE